MDGKKKFSIDMKISPFGEFRGRSAPDWFVARPKLMALVKDIPIKRTLMLDPKKWTQKDLEQGIYAVAKYELAIFSTALSTMQKDIDKAVPPKERKNKKFTSNTKNESKEEGAALSVAETKVKKLYARISKQITDKIDNALDEVEADKGDNKSALKAGKEALKKFGDMDTKNMFSGPAEGVQKALNDMASLVDKSGNPNDAAGLKKMNTALDAVNKEFEAKAKAAQNVAQYLLQKGAKMAKDDKADPALKQVGEAIAKNGNLKTAIGKLTATVASFDKSLSETVSKVRNGGISAANLRSLGKAFLDAHRGKDKAVDEAVSAVKIVSKKFTNVVKAVT